MSLDAEDLLFPPSFSEFNYPTRHCQSKILNTIGGHGIPWINPEKSREINGGEIRSQRAGKVFDFSLTMPKSGPEGPL